MMMMVMITWPSAPLLPGTTLSVKRENRLQDDDDDDDGGGCDDGVGVGDGDDDDMAFSTAPAGHNP